MISKWFNSKRLREKVRILFLLLVLTYITTICSVYYFFIKKNMLGYMLESNYNTMVSIGNNLNVELEAVGTMSQLIMTDSSVIKFLKHPNASTTRISHNAIMAMYDISNNFNYVSSIYVFKNNKEYINISNQVTNINMNIINDIGWQREVVEKAGSYVIKLNGDGAFIRKTGEPIISVVRLINDLDTQKPIGMIVVNLNMDILKNSFKDMTTEDRHFCYFDNNQEILYQVDDFIRFEGFEKMKVDDKEFNQAVDNSFNDTKILSYCHIPNTPLILVESEKVSFLGYISIQTIILSIILIALSIISFSIIVLFISVYIEKPIERLIQYMNIGKIGFEKEKYKKEFRLRKEVRELMKNKVNLIEINQIIDEFTEKEKAMQKAELQVLQEQIKPHFLYNTLSTIGDLALQNSAEDVYDAVETLGAFYRRFLNQGSREITIREEIAIVQDYLKLQKLRYQDVFEDEYEIEEDLLDFRIPKLILQPLVENSLYHGIRPKGEKGIIKISIFKQNGNVHINVFDTGVGMSRQQIETLMDVENNKSFGFKGTIERIRFYYDVEDVFEINSIEGEYFKVEIIVPLTGG